MQEHTHSSEPLAKGQQWIIWNGSAGILLTAEIDRIEVDAKGRHAWLARPFEMVGPFSLDELETQGRVSFAACVVMSRERWQLDQMALRQASRLERRAAQERLFASFARFNPGGGPRPRGQSHMVDEQAHRRVLNLPAHGQLKPSQVKAAFRRLAQKAHPDVGGSHEQFIQITAARDALLAGTP